MPPHPPSTWWTAGAALAALLLLPPSTSASNDPLGLGTPDADGHGDHAHVHGALGSSTHPDDHAPIGVMGSHPHRAGEVMFSYRYMVMDMDGVRDGRDELSEQEVFDEGFMVTPTDMTMRMHMFGAMYAWSDTLALMLMIPYVESRMNHVTMGGARFRTRSEGIGDISLSGIYTLWDGGHQQALLNAGLRIPTGSIDEEDVTPASGGMDVRLPYPMQTGSGTFDLQPGLTYFGHSQDWAWGAQALATVRLGENDNSYRLGNRVDATTWIARRLGESLSASLRFAGADWGDIEGADPLLNPGAVPTADPDLRGGTRFDGLVGLSGHGRSGWLAGQRLGVELGVPLYQDLDGPQLETDWTLTVGWQYAR